MNNAEFFLLKKIHLQEGKVYSGKCRRRPWVSQEARKMYGALEVYVHCTDTVIQC